MAPHSLDTILRQPQWPAALADFVTWCLMWDPKARPTSAQALAHDYFKDAVDPLRPMSKSSSRLLGRKQSNLSNTDLQRENTEASMPSLATKTSTWFRKSLIQREVSAPVVPTYVTPAADPTPVPSSHKLNSNEIMKTSKSRPTPSKRSTWTTGVSSNAAPIPILPSVKPISPVVSVSGTMAAKNTLRPAEPEAAAKKIGRQLSVNNHNHYIDQHRQQAEQALTGQSGLMSPTSGQKESFFSHLRKRARRFSGRYPIPMSPTSDDLEANAGCAPWMTGSNRQSMIIDGPQVVRHVYSPQLNEVSQTLQGYENTQADKNNRTTTNATLKRHHSVQRQEIPAESASVSLLRNKSLRRKPTHSALHYDTPDEEDELMSEVPSAHRASRQLPSLPTQHQAPPPPFQVPHPVREQQPIVQPSYLTPNPSGSRISVSYGHTDFATKPVPIAVKQQRSQDNLAFKWPTPPSDSEWGLSAMASISAAGAAYR